MTRPTAADKLSAVNITAGVGTSAELGWPGDLPPFIVRAADVNKERISLYYPHYYHRVRMSVYSDQEKRNL